MGSIPIDFLVRKGQDVNMSELPKPGWATLRRLSVQFGLDPRTIQNAITRGIETVRVGRTRDAAQKAIEQWQKDVQSRTGGAS